MVEKNQTYLINLYFCGENKVEIIKNSSTGSYSNHQLDSQRNDSLRILLLS